MAPVVVQANSSRSSSLAIPAAGMSWLGRRHRAGDQFGALVPGQPLGAALQAAPVIHWEQRLRRVITMQARRPPVPASRYRGWVA